MLPRHIAVYIAKKISNKSLSDLAKLFKRKNHSTIIHAFAKIDELQKKDINVKSEIDHIIAELKKL